MPTTFKELLAEAEAVVPTVSPAEALEMMRSAEVLTLDVREPFETETTGLIKGAINIPRGLLELTADTDGPHYNPAFEKHRTVLVYCTAGFRSALAGLTLLNMGFDSVFNIGGFDALADAGLEIERL